MSALFNDKQLQPTEEMLAEALGETKALLDSIGVFIETEFGEFHPEWKFYGSKLGWSLKLFNKKPLVSEVMMMPVYMATWKMAT